MKGRSRAGLSAVAGVLGWGEALCGAMGRGQHPWVWWPHCATLLYTVCVRASEPSAGLGLATSRERPGISMFIVAGRGASSPESGAVCRVQQAWR